MDYLAWGVNYPALILTSFLSATVLPGGSEVVFSAMVHRGYSPAGLILAAGTANTLGGLTNYFIARLGKEEWLSRYLGIKPATVKRMEAYVQRYGAFLAFFAWLPWVGDALAAALGFFRAPLAPVVGWMWVGKILRYVGLWLAVEGVLRWWI